MKNKRKLIYALIFLAFCFQACVSTKYVPDGSYLLEDVKIKSNVKGLGFFDLDPYVKQNPNYKVFALYKLPLHLYNLSGRDSTKFYNRWLKNVGEPPVLYDTTLTALTQEELKRVFVNKGYVNAQVIADVKYKPKKVNISYVVQPNKPFVISSYKIQLADSVFNNLSSTNDRLRRRRREIKLDSLSLMDKTLVKNGALFDLSMLDDERGRVATLFRRNGYYTFNKEYIGYVADTLSGNNQVALEMVFYPYAKQLPSGKVVESSHRKYYINSVKVYVDYDPLRDGNIQSYRAKDSVEVDSCQIYYGESGRYITPNILMESIRFRPGMVYDDQFVNNAYAALSRYNILDNVNIRFYPASDGDTSKLDCFVTCFPEKRQGFVTEIEGTNTTGFSSAALGAAASVSYQHRNLFKGSELFAIKLEGSFDALSSKSFNIANNYYEIGGETSLTFPRFMFPFLSGDFKRRSRASTQFATSYTYQQYPEYYKRTIFSGAVKYIWQDRRNSLSKQTLNLIDLSYVHFPYLSKSFYDSLPQYTRIYSFQDQFVAGIGYSINNTNFNPMLKSMQPIHSFQASIETAGNSLDLAAKLFHLERDSDGMRKIFGTYYAQYVRMNVDYSRTIRFNPKNSYAWHIGAGIAVPYGNSQTIPIQKRFFSGGSMSVRGWNVRELGPGSYYSKDGTFYNHSGDIRLDANVEYRSKVFWKFELAAFLDAGNVWTIKDYEGQEGGVFKLNSFYNQIAVAWGLGLRLDFDFLLLRLDCGWKAYDPANNPDRTNWQIVHPFDLRRNTAWHIAIGYPF